MSQGTIVEFLRAQGLSEMHASLARLRFAVWMKKNRTQPTRIVVGGAGVANTFDFETLIAPWETYKAMRIARGLKP